MYDKTKIVMNDTKIWVFALICADVDTTYSEARCRVCFRMQPVVLNVLGVFEPQHPDQSPAFTAAAICSSSSGGRRVVLLAGFFRSNTCSSHDN